MVTWQWKKDLRKKGSKLDAWQAYSALVGSKIEEAYQSGAKVLKLSSVYSIDFKGMVQYRCASAF